MLIQIEKLARQGNHVVTEVEPMNTKYTYIINEYSKEEITSILQSNGWHVAEIVDKPFIDDPNSLAPNTLVIIAERRK